MKYGKIKQQFIDHEIYNCEYDEPHECSYWCMNFAHRHKRIEYKNREHLLEDFNQVAYLCENSHNLIEHSRTKTAEFFQKIRGDDII